MLVHNPTGGSQNTRVGRSEYDFDVDGRILRFSMNDTPDAVGEARSDWNAARFRRDVKPLCHSQLRSNARRFVKLSSYAPVVEYSELLDFDIAYCCLLNRCTTGRKDPDCYKDGGRLHDLTEEARQICNRRCSCAADQSQCLCALSVTIVRPSGPNRCTAAACSQACSSTCTVE